MKWWKFWRSNTAILVILYCKPFRNQTLSFCKISWYWWCFNVSIPCKTDSFFMLMSIRGFIYSAMESHAMQKYRGSHRELFCEKDVIFSRSPCFLNWLKCSGWKLDSYRDRIFFAGHFSRAQNKFILSGIQVFCCTK